MGLYTENTMAIAAIDFGRLYRDHLAAASPRLKSAGAWDRRAASMSVRNRKFHSHYVDAFVSRMDFTQARSLLDVGCGPGTLCLSLADRFDRIHGLDYSRGMLDVLMAGAASRGLTHIEPLHLSWEDDWTEVPECDVVIASRSTLVSDMAAALRKLDEKARLRVYLTHLVGGCFLDPEIPALLGRSQPPLPDYIYILNILYRMGIHPRLDYIENDKGHPDTSDFTDFARRVRWTLGELSAEELDRLKAWHDRTKRSAVAPMRWAFISWEKTPAESR